MMPHWPCKSGEAEGVLGVYVTSFLIQLLAGTKDWCELCLMTVLGFVVEDLALGP